MSQKSSLNLKTLEKSLRNQLERTVKAARDVAEEAAFATCEQLGVGRAKADVHLSEEDKELRRRLRIHGRQLGDEQDAKGVLKLDRLVEEIAYEHWHRMLFARFLAENDLLMYPDPEEPVSVSIEECDDLAADEGAKNGWELAARFAARMLPQIFRVDSPVFSLALPPEKQQQLERLLADLPAEVFSASDSLGWVYQFWQAKRKDEVNASEVKIGARELPAVTQLFTEPYMVSFLLDNSLGAWWAARRLTEKDLATAETEQHLREKASLPGVPLEYLRFVKDETSGRWAPAAGTFDAWPKQLGELKTLDPCCGSGHFLVAALLMLVPMRMELEGLSARDAVDRVLSENLHGLEIDQRCVELAAFALALTAWRFPTGGGYRVLPALNVACCGLSVSVAKEEWKALAKDNSQLKIALDWMYDEFKDAPILGSLLHSSRRSLPPSVQWRDFAPMLAAALANEKTSETSESGVVAYGLARAASVLGSSFSLVITNVPYLGRGKQNKQLLDYCEERFSAARSDLATVFIQRCVELTSSGGTCCCVTPQNWLFLSSYKKFRQMLLENQDWNLVARLGPGAFQEVSGEVVKAVLVVLSKPESSGFDLLDDKVGGAAFYALDVAAIVDSEGKAKSLKNLSAIRLHQNQQIANPDSRVVLEHLDRTVPQLSEFAACYQGLVTGDIPRFTHNFWEVIVGSRKVWVPIRGSTADDSKPFGGMEDVLLWEEGKGQLAEYAMRTRDQLHDMHESGNLAWGQRGVCINRMANLRNAIFLGEHFHNNLAAIIPSDKSHVLPLHAYCSSEEFFADVRRIDQKVSLTNRTAIQVPFDLPRWQQVAAENYPHGLPEPYSDDPTQWIFHGHPASSTDPLQVAVARLLGYRWPAELDAEMELATDARAWVERSGQLAKLADKDGIVCIPAVGTEQPADDRLLNLLHLAYEDGRAQEQLFRDKLDAADGNDPVTVDLWRRGWQPSLPGTFPAWRDSLLERADHKGKTLDSWLRDKFFSQHCKLFQHRPFIWHVWDGLKDGFSVLINYHKLDNKLLEKLIYTYLNDWINRQKQDRDAGVDGSEEKLAAAEWLKECLELILEGESPHDIFVRWKPLEEQPIGWNPDLNDGVRLNIRPWMTIADAGKKGAGLLRDKPNIDWKKDRGADVESAPWYHLGPEYEGKEGDRINDHTLTLEVKQAARKKKGKR